MYQAAIALGNAAGRFTTANALTLRRGRVRITGFALFCAMTLLHSSAVSAFDPETKSPRFMASCFAILMALLVPLLFVLFAFSFMHEKRRLSTHGLIRPGDTRSMTQDALSVALLLVATVGVDYAIYEFLKAVFDWPGLRDVAWSVRTERPGSF